MTDLVAVDTGNGLVVWHRREEYEVLMRGVDQFAAALHYARLEMESEPKEDPS